MALVNPWRVPQSDLTPEQIALFQITFKSGWRADVEARCAELGKTFPEIVADAGLSLTKNQARNARKKQKRIIEQRGATITRAGYREYIQSPEWRKKRDEYWDSGLPNECYCCGTPRHSGMHLHHRTYKRLGNEYLRDLVPVCQTCHEEIHVLHREQRGKARGLWYVTNRVRSAHSTERRKREQELPPDHPTARVNASAKRRKAHRVAAVSRSVPKALST